MTTPNQKRFVAHFDMLGMMAATHRNENEAWGALSDLKGGVGDVDESMKVLTRND